MSDKINYQVNLPQTTFPMKGNLPEREPKILEFWQQIKLHEKIMRPTTSHSNKFVLHDGPPYANGDIHLGHVLNKVFKDIINKINFMEGYAVPYVPGWDCHGLPIELNIEKKFGKAGEKISVSEFMQSSRDYANSQVQSQLTDFKRLGILGDWEHPYLTMDFNYEANIVRALAKIIENGYMVRGHKPVHWCIDCGSALAEAEVEYKDKISPAIDIRFRLVKPQQLANNITAASIAIWTTTPWTLPANEAVALHPELEYVLLTYQQNNQPEYLLLLKELTAETMHRYGVTEYHIVKSYQGKDLVGLKLQHPFLDKQVPIIAGDHVTTDTGTGAVHTAPAHGLEDYVAAQRYQLPITNPVGPNGKFFDDTPYFAGKNVFTANDEVIKLIAERNNLIHHTTIQHSYPHCWRHKTPLIFRATQQWFISMDNEKGKFGKLRQCALAAIEHEVNWLHPHGKERITKMIEQRPDWCISRQRSWGTPIAVFVHKQTGELHPETQRIMAAIANEIALHGIAFWQQLDEKAAEGFLTKHSNAQQYPIKNYVKAKDTLDVWFDSGVSHFCVLQQRPELKFPAHLYIEGSDQYRGWFQSSLLTSLAINGCAPYRNVMSHGFTVDGAGHKMSKSLGNVISPQKVIKNFGADILRLWLATSFPYDDISVSDEILRGNVDTYRKLRNTARYLLSNLYDFNPSKDLLQMKEMLPIDRWVLNEIQELQEKVRQHNNQPVCVNLNKIDDGQETLLKFYTSCAQIQYTAAVTLSSFYFSIIKDRLYTMRPNSKERRSAQTALYHVLEVFVRLLAPFLSFTAEEIWQNMRELFQGKENDDSEGRDNDQPNDESDESKDQEKHEGNKNERAESVFLAPPYNVLKKLQTTGKLNLDPFKQSDWQIIQDVYAAVAKEIEKLRAVGIVGSSLEAEVKLYCNDDLYDLLQKFTPSASTKPTLQSSENELRLILITSNAEILRATDKLLSNQMAHEVTTTTGVSATDVDGLWLHVARSPHPKCPRCWHHRADIGKHKTHPELCDRCAKVLAAKLT